MDIRDITSRSKFIFTNTMLCLLKGLEGKQVKVDIRNDSTIQGTLMSVDAVMGLNMMKVSMTNAKGQATHLDLFYIQGRNVRYVHIPDEVDILQTMHWELNKSTFFRDNERANQRQIMKKNMDRKKKQQQKLQKY